MAELNTTTSTPGPRRVVTLVHDHEGATLVHETELSKLDRRRYRSRPQPEGKRADLKRIRVIGDCRESAALFDDNDRRLTDMRQHITYAFELSQRYRRQIDAEVESTRRQSDVSAIEGRRQLLGHLSKMSRKVQDRGHITLRLVGVI